MEMKKPEECEIVRLNESISHLKEGEIAVVIHDSSLTGYYTLRTLDDRTTQALADSKLFAKLDPVDLINQREVESSGGDKTYIIRLYATGARGRYDGGRAITCTCPGYRFVARCKHQELASSHRGALKT